MLVPRVSRPIDPEIDSARSSEVFDRELGKCSLQNLTYAFAIGSDTSRVHELPLCNGALIAAFTLMRPSPSLSDDRKLLRKMHPEFVNALFSFFLTSRTPAQFQSLQDTLATCRCYTRDTGIEVLHDALKRKHNLSGTLGHLAYDGDRSKEMISAGFNVMMLFLCDVHAGRLESVSKQATARPGDSEDDESSAISLRSGKPDRESCQPKRTDAAYIAMAHFLHSNVEETVRTCVQWYSATHLSAILTFLTQCLHTYSTRFIVPIISHRSLAHIVSRELVDFYKEIGNIAHLQQKKIPPRLYLQRFTRLWCFLEQVIRFTTPTELVTFLGSDATAVSMYCMLSFYVNSHAPSQPLAEFIHIPNVIPFDAQQSQRRAEAEENVEIMKRLAHVARSIWEAIPEHLRPRLNETVLENTTDGYYTYGPDDKSESRSTPPDTSSWSQVANVLPSSTEALSRWRKAQYPLMFICLNMIQGSYVSQECKNPDCGASTALSLVSTQDDVKYRILTQSPFLPAQAAVACRTALANANVMRGRYPPVRINRSASPSRPSVCAAWADFLQHYSSVDEVVLRNKIAGKPESRHDIVNMLEAKAREAGHPVDYSQETCVVDIKTYPPQHAYGKRRRDVKVSAIPGANPIADCWPSLVDCVITGAVEGFNDLYDDIMEEITDIVEICREELGYDQEKPETDVLTVLDGMKKLGERFVRREGM